MKKLTVLLCVLCGLASGCYTTIHRDYCAPAEAQTQTTYVEKSPEAPIEPKATVKQIEKQIKFFKHEKSGLCFAYVWGGSGHGGPALSLVSCETVGL